MSRWCSDGDEEAQLKTTKHMLALTQALSRPVAPDAILESLPACNYDCVCVCAQGSLVCPTFSAFSMPLCCRWAEGSDFSELRLDKRFISDKVLLCGHSCSLNNLMRMLLT